MVSRTIERPRKFASYQALHLCDLLEKASVADLEKVHTEFRERLFFLSEHEVGSLLLMKFCARISDLNLEEPNILLFDDHIADLERMKMTLLNGIGSKALMNIVHVCNKDEVFAMLLKRTVHIDIMKESMDVRPLFSSLFRTLNVRQLEDCSLGIMSCNQL
ncbi:unnamed protein product [Brassica oleracea]